MTYTIAADRYTRPHSPATTAVGLSRRTAAVHPGWASLTPAELRVARLVAEGLTNRAVAQRLCISPHTVDSHLRHAFAKLGISSRVALARLTLIHDHIRADEPADR
ncbi:helix-turn-helix transcriptional regulator [Streptomyces achromogenes]|uniref:helix-turn-helix domain-containing protein n=1 Tax=Streptomyces achromogenes TaxID=67255 RepID=UPI003684DF33